MAFTRVVQGRGATLTHTFYSDGTATNPSPDTATIGITRDDGTVLVAAGTATTDTGTGTVSYPLTPTHTAALDMLKVTWTASFGGQSQGFIDYVEIRGDVLFTVADARTIKPLDSTANYSTAAIVAARTLAETALEEACMVPFVPTYFTCTLDGNGKTDILLPITRPLTITSAVIDGVAATVSDIKLYDTGNLFLGVGWSRDWSSASPASQAKRRNIVITGTYGYAAPPPRVSRACLLLAKRFLVDSPVSDRATSLTTQDGTTQFLVTAGIRQAVFDIPEANAVVDQYGVRRAYAIA
jgi:hypothetical protein